MPRHAPLLVTSKFPLIRKITRLARVPFRLLLAAALIAGQMTAGSGRLAAQQAPANDIKKMTERMTKFLDVLEVISDGFDTRAFTVAGQAELLENDAARIVEFVTSEIGFEPYVGSLRGPLGARPAPG